jgi:hypothetical protein
MAGEIFKVWLIRPTEAFYALPVEERAAVSERARQALAQAGGEYMLICDSAWCSETWPAWGVERFPDMEAVQRHARLLASVDALRYFESQTLLGTEAA